MNEDYLWDRSGEPDEETARLERLLGRLQFSGAASPPALEPSRQARIERKTAQRRWWRVAAAAAAVVTIGIATAWWFRGSEFYGPVTAWQLSISGRKPSAMRAGQTIETGAAIQATMESEFVGEVRIEPESRVRLLAAGEEEQRFALDRGTIHALIWAPPRRFVVDTPSAKTVDLGCQYTLHVAKNGIGTLTVETGWVAFQWRNLESFIPAGAACTTRPGRGPGTPHFLDAPEALIDPVARFDGQGDSAGLANALSAARKRDALTLWHLLSRTHGPLRGEVYDRFAALVEMPPTLTRDAIMRGDGQALDAAWDALDLGDTSWWRGWKRQW